ncbi:MAG: sigma-54-dependent transcriptional regulator [Alkalispirochaeta sp.]
METSIVLAVDDDPVQLEIIKNAASKLEYPSIEVIPAENVTAALTVLKERSVDMVITDQRMPDGNALDVVRESVKRNPLVPVIVITAFESVEDAVQLLKHGARDYIVKPLRPQDIQQLLINTLEWHRREQDVQDVTDTDGAGAGSDAIESIGETTSESMRVALGIAARAADAETSVLIHGESGTGKEVMARLIHSNSSRASGPFVPVNVAAIPETLVESELFGHKKGAFTGAQNDREGYFQRAKGGTLFIDELGDIPLNVQVKLLRAIQFREVYPLGQETPVKLDVRILTATNRDLPEMIRRGEFREDLYYRVNVISIEIPPLRERRGDIPLLTELFIRRFADQNGRRTDGITQRGLNYLIRYDFPGNIRELENILERAVVLSSGPMITEKDLPPFVTGGDPLGDATAPMDATTDEPEESATSLDGQIHALEKKLLLEALRKTNGHQSRAASLLEITERRLRSRMERLKIQNPF